MKISLNAFLTEVRRHFGKYPPKQKSSILFRFSLALSVFSLVLIGTGMYVDQFHSDDPSDIDLGQGVIFHAPGISIGHTRMRLTYPECSVPEVVEREKSSMFDPKGVYLSELPKGPMGTDEVYDAFVSPGDDTLSTHYFGDFATFYKMSKIARVMSWIAFGLQVLTLIVSITTRTPPFTFLTNRPIFGHSSSERSWGALHHAITVLVAVCLLVDIAVVSLYLDLLIGRIVEWSFELCNFSPGTDELETMKLYGRILHKYADVNGMTGGLYKCAISLTMIQTVFVFFLGTDQVRTESASAGYSLPASRLRQLPWYASIWRFRFALLFFVFAVITDIAASIYSSNHGYPLNIFAFKTVFSARTGTGSTRSGAMVDFIMDKTAKFYISDSLPTSVMFGCLALVAALAVGSTDPARFMSKIVQLLGLLVFLKAINATATLEPVPSTVISKPYCYDEPHTLSWSISGLFRKSISCNHLMFSINSAICTMCFMTVMMFVRYGPSAHRYGAYVLLSTLTVVCMLLPVVARTNYTIDTLVGLYMSVLLILSQSSAFKLLFRFDVPSLDLLAPMTALVIHPPAVLNDKVIPILTECVRRIEMYQLAIKDVPGLKITSSDVDEIQLLYSSVGMAMKVARDAKPIEPMSPVGYARPKSHLVHTKVSDTPPDEDISDIMNLMSMAASERQPLVRQTSTPELIEIRESPDSAQAEGVIEQAAPLYPDVTGDVAGPPEYLNEPPR